MIRERVNFSGQNFASFLNPAESFRREFRIFNFSFLESTCLLFIFLDKFDLSKSCELRMIGLKNECNILRRLSQTVILLHKGHIFRNPEFLSLKFGIEIFHFGLDKKIPNLGLSPRTRYWDRDFKISKKSRKSTILIV